MMFMLSAVTMNETYRNPKAYLNYGEQLKLKQVLTLTLTRNITFAMYYALFYINNEATP